MFQVYILLLLYDSALQISQIQYKSEAERYYKELKERMEKFGMEMESSKSRLIEFGRFAEQNRRARGE